MTELETMRDRLDEQIVAVNTHVATMVALRDAVVAEIARVPTLEDVKALVARVP